jgi:3-deoxy-D-manno-octulosonate 8-phosphate phosphatase (KDO 8-P phosphatase)
MVEPGAPIPEDVAKRVALVVFDVDGVLTDGGVYLGMVMGGREVELKRFDIQDGLGMKMLQWAGLKVVIVSGRNSEANVLRAEELGIPLHQDDGAQKVPAIRKVMDRMGIGWDQVAMLADDLPDVPVLNRAGLKGAVANAVPLVAALANWRATRSGGHGAAREFCEALLMARGQLKDVVERYVAERSEP